MIYNTTSDGSGPTASSVKNLLYRVFAWMSAAVGISGLTAIALAQYPDLLAKAIAAWPILLIAQLGIVIILSWRIMTLSYFTAQVLFIIYAVLMGATLSVIFLVYTTQSIAQVFIIAAAMFAAMALYGAYTRTDLAQYRSLLFMTLVGLVIAGLVNIFLKSSMLDFVTAVVGVLLFSALTAFDIQNIQKLAGYLIEQGEDWNKIALLGALQLYLDFINLFLSLLRLFGQRK
jgi:FtsH-binding integral membrane protein